MTKRYRVPKAKPGQLRMDYAHSNDGKCIHYNWGDGCSHSDGHLLHYMCGAPRLEHVYSGDPEYGKYPTKYGPSFFDELEKRGYDLKTLKFSIQKKAT